MEGSLTGWLRDWELPENRNLYGCKIRLPEGIFKVQEYVNAQAKRTEWLVQRRPRLTQFMKLARPGAPRIGGSVRSYILQQEFEARSRSEKLRVAEEKGHTWFSLQHDGVVIGLKQGTSPVQFANTLTKYVSSTLGYTQKVEVKRMESEWANPTPWVWDTDRDIPETEITLTDSQDTTKFKEWFNKVTTCTSTREAVYTYNCIALYPIGSSTEGRETLSSNWSTKTKLYNANKEVWEKKLWDTQLRIRRTYLNLEGTYTSPPPTGEGEAPRSTPTPQGEGGLLPPRTSASTARTSSPIPAHVHTPSTSPSLTHSQPARARPPDSPIPILHLETEPQAHSTRPAATYSIAHGTPTAPHTLHAAPPLHTLVTFARRTSGTRTRPHFAKHTAAHSTHGDAHSTRAHAPGEVRQRPSTTSSVEGLPPGEVTHRATFV